MFDSKNLPLSKLKIIKKFIKESYRFDIFILILLLSLKWSYGAGNANFDSIYYNLKLIVLILLITINVIILIYEYLYYKMYYYNFENEQAEIRKGVINRSTGLVVYQKIQNVYIDQDIIDRFFGLYDVHYETAGESSNFYSHVDGLNKYNSSKLIDFLVGKTNEDQTNKTNRKGDMPNTIETKSINPNSTTDITYSRKNINISPKLLVERIIMNLVASLVIVAMIFTFIMVYTENIFNTMSQSVNIVIIIYIVGTLIATFLAYVLAKMWCNNFYFLFDKEKGEIKQGSITLITTTLNYDRIQNVTIDQGLMDRLFNIYSLNIENAAAQQLVDMSIPALSNEDAQKLKNFLLEKSKEAKK